MRYWLPNRKILSGMYQAPNVQLPEGGAQVHESFQFPGLAATDTQETTRIFESATVLTHITGSFSGAGAFLMVYHIHNGVSRPLYNKPRPLDSVCGSAQLPFFFVPTIHVQAGDSFMVEVKSTDKVNAQLVEVDIFGAEVPA